MKLRLEMNTPAQIVKRLGLDPGGKAQQYHTENVLRRIQRYMPYRTGATIKIMIAQTDPQKPEIVLDVPYGKYLFYGKVMIGPAPKKLTDIPLKYTTTKNPDAGAHWDEKLTAAEGGKMARELEDFIRSGGST